MPRKYVPKRAPIRTLVQDSSAASLNAQGRVALFAFLLRELGDAVAEPALKRLHQQCLEAAVEASLAIEARRGSRIDSVTKRRIGASRHAVRVFTYVLLHRLSAALREAGVAPGLWGAGQRAGQAIGPDQGRVYRFMGECAQLAGVALPQNLDRIRQGSARIVRQAFKIPPHKHVSAV